jgi:cytoskeletal protein RodZ
MTARDQARAAAQRFGVDRHDPVDPGPSLPDRLTAARERKGVDLIRAERETKIRVRYLSALESGDYRDLPGAVYTKGFLRNYAIYLGLDPEDVLRQWRRERGEATAPEPVIVPPRPLDAPARPLNFSPSIVVAALLTVGVVLFFVYLGAQLLRYSRPPELAVTNPAEAVVNVDEATTSFRLAGTSTAGATITILTPGQEEPYRTTAQSNGDWSMQVDLRRGQNRFEINAVNPETGKAAETPRTVVITVPFLEIQAPTLTVTAPVDGTKYGNGAIAVEGTTTNAKTVSVVASFLGSGAGAPAASPTPTSVPGAGGASSGTTIDVATDGSFSFPPLELTAGRWSVTVTATSAEGKTATRSMNVEVAFSGVNLVVNVKGSPAWIKVWVDGKLVGPQSGRVLEAGKSLTFHGTTSVEVRTGSSGATQFTLNGTSIGSLGKSGVPETWLFKPPDPPVKTQRT